MKKNDKVIFDPERVLFVVDKFDDFGYYRVREGLRVFKIHETYVKPVLTDAPIEYKVSKKFIETATAIVFISGIVIGSLLTLLFALYEDFE